MATWLNLALAGDCTFTVYRDGAEVTDLAAVGASLSTIGGAVTLETPDDETHLWRVEVQANYLPTSLPVRMRAFDLSHPLGIVSASAISGSQTVALTVNEPNATPDPATFTANASMVALSVQEDT